MNINKVFESMSLEEEEVPFNLPNLPQYSAVERNKLSIVGRILNPECQKVRDVILDMPRKWQVYDRVKGFALSKTMFQFVFKYEHDLEEVLRKMVWTCKEWSIVIDRWMENPPEDYLKFLLVWVQIRNIPVNYFTYESIEAFGDLIGRVDTVAFDPNKTHTLDYVRVRVFFDVSRPVRKSKVINLPCGGSVELRFDFERLQKRCFHCQRLTHDKDKCPLLIQERKDQAKERKQRILAEKQSREHFLVPDDPLFGVLAESQVGFDPNTGRRKINPEVLQNMREYLLAAEGGERKIREERVRKSVSALDNDPRGQKNFLRLEPDPALIRDVNHGKGLTFDYPENETPIRSMEGRVPVMIREETNTGLQLPARDIPTGFSFGLTEARYSGNLRARSGIRRRPPKRFRKFKPKEGESARESANQVDQETGASAAKRRAEVMAGNFSKFARVSQSKAVPSEGLRKL